MPGTITGQLGSITVSTSGGNGATAQDFYWNNMLPGVPNSATVNYQNTSANAEDIYLVFQNKTALSALNNLGTYGEVHVAAAGTGTANAEIFASANLNDRASTCGPFSPSGCWPVPNVIKVASSIGGGTTGSVTFAFNYAGKLSGGQGGLFNLYPVADQQNPGTDALGPHAGLPYEVVAIQAGAPAPTVS